MLLGFIVINIDHTTITTLTVMPSISIYYYE